MILSDKFVIINFPKTGSTFVRKALKKIKNDNSFFKKILRTASFNTKPIIKNYWVENIRDTTFRRGKKDEHGLCIQIPKEYQNKQIVSIKRNIFERYISLYEFGDWKKAPWIDTKIIKKEFHSYPNLTFKEYLKFIFKYNPWQSHPKINKQIVVGPATTQFIMFYFKEPFKVLNNLNKEFLSKNNYKNDMFDVHFLDQNSLNKDLFSFLLKNGFKKRKIKFIMNAKKENVSRPKNKTLEDYFNPDLISMVEKKDEILFKIFNDYQI